MSRFQAVLLIFSLFFATSVLAAPIAGEYQENTLIVKFKPGFTPQSQHLAKNQTGTRTLDSVLNQFTVQSLKKALPGASELDTFGLGRVYEIRFGEDVDIAELIERFETDPTVEYAEPRYLATIDDVRDDDDHIRDTPNDPDFGDPAHPERDYHLTIIEAVAAWDISHGSSDVVIAIVDNGTDMTHEDLQGNLWTNSAEANGQPGVDDDGNGYIDDIHGYDFYDDDGDPTPGNQSSDDHGTHTAGIAAAVTNNNTGVAAISWNCQIMPVRAGSNRTISYGYESIYYAAHNGADVINNSWSGYSASRFDREIIEDAYLQGAVIVGAAGNDGTSQLNFPAAFDNVISVAGTNSSDIKAWFTNYGGYVDVSAPGQSIWSTLKDDSYGSKSGTSMSSPLVAGLCGLVKAYHPDWNNDQVATQVILSADNIDDINPGYAGQLGSGRINAFRALNDSFDAIIMTSYQVDDSVNGNDDGELDPGEISDFYLTLRSLFSSIDNVSVTLSVDNPFVTIVNPTLDYGDLPEGEYITNTTAFQVVASGDLPYGEVLNFSLTIAGDGYNGEETFVYLVPPIIGNHDSGNFVFTITSEGEIGFWKSGSDFAQGDGFVYPADDGENVFYSGSFVAGTDPNYVCDAMFNTGEVGDNDWQIDEGNDGFLYFDSSADVPQIGHCIFTDGNHGLPRGLQVSLESWTFSEPPDDDYIILNYTLRNNGTNAINNLYAGLFIDWDMGDSAQDDEAAVDDVNDLVWQRGNDYDVFTGMALVDPAQTTNLSVIDNETYVYDGLQLQDSDLYQFLNGDLQFDASPDADDYTITCSSGPYDLPAGGSVPVSFIVAAGDDLADLQSNISSARVKFDDVLNLEISGFTAQLMGETVELTWNILDTTNVIGYNILRSERGNGGDPAVVNDLIITSDYYQDTGVEFGQEYSYWIEVVHSDGGSNLYGPTFISIPLASFHLERVMPNPFTTMTTIRFSLEQTGWSKLRIYNAAGQLVKNLDADYSIGTNTVEWDRRNDNGAKVGSGVYIVRMEQAGQSATQTMVVLPD